MSLPCLKYVKGDFCANDPAERPPLKYSCTFRPSNELKKVAEILDDLEGERHWREREAPPDPALEDGFKMLRDDEWLDFGDGIRMRRTLPGAE